MSDSLALDEQRSLVLRWLETPSARSVAASLCHRRGLTDAASTDLVHDAWVRVDESFRRRAIPYPGLNDEVAAERFARRVMSNLAIDRLRSGAHRLVSPSDDAAVLDSAAPTPWSGLVDTIAEVESRDSVFRLRRHLGARLSASVDPCPGCPSTVVAAVALYVCNALAIGDVPNRGGNPLDHLIYEGLQSHDPANFSNLQGRPTDAQRKRKSRCGSCIVALLRSCAAQAGLGAS